MTGKMDDLETDFLFSSSRGFFFCIVGFPFASLLFAKQLLKSHRAVVSAIRWSPHSAFHLASCDYDGVVKVWDMRSPMPLHSLPTHAEEKALCLDWFEQGVATGGADCKVKFQAIKLR